mmetsp:Transcript_24127/g.44834  ORF Transcript_24127/g.44834 Transcript_24127/m.44834 type:complete len:218 (-) Transcript_24127:10062-10715(-)
MHDQRGPMFDGAAQVGRGRCVVDDQRYFGGVRHSRDRIQIGDVATRVGNRFAENRAGVVINGRLDRIQIVKVDKGRRPPEPLDGLAELGDRAAIKAGGDHDIHAWAHQREQRHDLCGMTRGTAHAADTALKGGDPFLQHGHRWVGQAGIDVSDLLQVKEGGGVLCIAEHIGGRLVDRRLTRACGRVWPCACVNLKGIKAVCWAVSHDVCPLRYLSAG